MNLLSQSQLLYQLSYPATDPKMMAFRGGWGQGASPAIRAYSVRSRVTLAFTGGREGNGAFAHWPSYLTML